ncbi:MAG: UDP-glucose 6-dehydrogenase [Candidatus Moranbacteria bacterium CG10_big_fil_rev_8_21_14_0_10_35_21]|nr:MAG: UDP-glucose 6-dehydrogenase [Candidatus Moranbacteria bacterium CG10_big_fil_rev_8_21_14_0_10_35_21]PJA88261.1 MAG: UDP-glucose 6-dehydrogenase [Candidatus Moranbacteria bacterium CG_4_9_14_3_um_filter_36_9]
MNLTFIGTGYVGLVTGTCMAEMGHNVICADIDKNKIHSLKKGGIPIYEMGLEELVKRNVKEGRLFFTTDIKKAIQSSEVIFNAVGTPEDKKTGQADLQYVFTVAKSFGKYINAYKIFVNKSTVPVGTAEKVKAIIQKYNKNNIDFDAVSNPEFLREGAAVKDFLNPDRVVIGISSERAKKLMEKIYKPIARIGRPIIFTDVKSAEIIKYASNAFLATKISFINEIANFCEKVGGNVKEISKGMGLDSRVGNRFLQAGIGYGGSCFPKDIKALIHTGKQNDYVFEIVTAVDKVNQKQKLKAFEILKKQLRTLRGKNITLWGLSFKPRTDDIREAPALDTIENILALGGNVLAFDPVAEANMKKVFSSKKIKYYPNPYSALKNSDVLIIMTEWDEFRNPDYPKMTKLMRGKIIIDGRNILDKTESESEGFRYFGIGV